jgi:pyrimidine-nucleoside phosphorylase
MTSGPLFTQAIIARKRDGHALSEEEIRGFVRGATDGSWADYQLSALLMAVWLRGMTPQETAVLTDAIVRSGSAADLSRVPRYKVDKHSTGGVGDKVSIPLAPMAAACGLAVPMISGRALGHTGGTLDKLESIPGFRTALPLREFEEQVARIGVALIGQTAELAPADRKLYALRDATATVECIPLICGSIMGKKLSEGIDGLVLDVKFGRGAFMREKARARELALALSAIGTASGKSVRALLTAMEEPLGRTVGNALEVAESVDCLKGRGPADVMEVTYALGQQMLLMGGIARTAPEARAQLEQSVSSGAALAKFAEIVAAQDGDPRVADDPGFLPRAPIRLPLVSESAGFVRGVDAMGVALAALRLGAGRTRAEDRIDPAVGVSALVKVGETVARGGTLCMIHAADRTRAEEARTILKATIELGPERLAPAPLIAEVIGA